MLKFGRIEGDWSDQPLYIIGGGPSLKGFPFDRIPGRKLGCNKAAWLSGSDALVTLDQNFARQCRADIQRFADNGGEVVMVMPPSENGHKQIEGATYVQRVRNQGLSTQPDRLYGVHTGYAALGLAFLKGAKEIALLGIDMQVSKGGFHWHDSYPWQNEQAHRFMGKWADGFERAYQQLTEAGVSVTNFVDPNMPLRLATFPTRPLEDLL